jgi:hypothetical protein
VAAAFRRGLRSGEATASHLTGIEWKFSLSSGPVTDSTRNLLTGLMMPLPDTPSFLRMALTVDARSCNGTLFQIFCAPVRGANGVDGFRSQARGRGFARVGVKVTGFEGMLAFFSSM